MAIHCGNADRLLADVDAGTNGGVAWTRPASVPARSDTLLVTTYAYNDAAWTQDVTAPSPLTEGKKGRDS